MAKKPTRKAPPKKSDKATAASRWESLSTWEPFQIDGLNVRCMRKKGPAHQLVPKLKPYLFREAILRELAWAIWPHDGAPPSPVLAVGPKGTGKTTLIKQLAARANQGVYRTNLSIGTTVKHLMGHRGAKDGSTVFYDGIVTRAMEEGLWLILDEVSGATPHVALTLFPVMESDGEVYLSEAEPARYIKRHPDFRIFMTDNVLGAAQEETRFNYSGTNPDQNEALLDRIHSTIQMGYPEPKEEHAIVRMNLPHLTEAHADWVQLVIRIVSKIRADKQAPAFSTRMVIEWVRRITAGRQDAAGKVYQLDKAQIMQAAQYAFLSKMRSKGDETVVLEVISRALLGEN